jgi:hypothetical protein
MWFIFLLPAEKCQSGNRQHFSLTAVKSNISAIMGGVPSIPTDPTRSLKITGAGYSRTGTLSMALALEKLLDGPVMHGGSQLLGREDRSDPTSLFSLGLLILLHTHGCTTNKLQPTSSSGLRSSPRATINPASSNSCVKPPLAS